MTVVQTSEDLRTRELRVIELLAPLVNPLGYQIVDIEVDFRQKTLRIYIDHLNGTQGIQIADCVKVTHALDEPLEKDPELQTLFANRFELEVSSPGIQRPLRTPADFKNYAQQTARLMTSRALTAEELGNAAYQEKNPRQKNFYGILLGFENDAVLFQVSEKNSGSQASKPSANSLKKQSKKKAGDLGVQKNEGEKQIRIPLRLLTKANLEPENLFEAREERE